MKKGETLWIVMDKDIPVYADVDFKVAYQVMLMRVAYAIALYGFVASLTNDLATQIYVYTEKVGAGDTANHRLIGVKAGVQNEPDRTKLIIVPDDLEAWAQAQFSQLDSAVEIAKRAVEARGW